MFVRFVEIFLIFSLLLISWQIVRRSFAATLLRLALRVVAFTIGVACGIVAFGPLETVTSNFVLQFILAYAVGVVWFVLAALCFSRLVRRGEWTQRLENALRLPRWLDRSLVVTILLVFWLAVLVGADLTGQLISSYPQIRASADRSLVLRHFVESRREHAASAIVREFSPEQKRVMKAMAEQADFFSRFRQGLRQSSEKLLSVTGSETLLPKFDAVQQILRLPSDEKRWLLRQHPNLMALSDHPTVRKIAANETLVAHLERVSEGSLESVYRIGDDPDVRWLLEDPDVRRLILEVDPAQLLGQVKTYRKSRRSETAETSESGDGGRSRTARP